MNQRHTAPAEQAHAAGSRTGHSTTHATRGAAVEKATAKRVTSTWCGKDSVQTGCGEDSAQESRFWSGLARL